MNSIVLQPMDYLALDFFDVPSDWQPPDGWNEARLEKGLTPMFASPGGKWFAANKFTKLFPSHARYVEPFAGSAAIFWKKDPAPMEVLNDLRQNLIDTFRFVRDAKDFEPFVNLNWEPSKKRYLQLEKSKPDSPMMRAYRYLYLAASKFSNILATGYSRKVAVDRMHKPDRHKLQKWHDRLRHVTLLAQDALSVIKKYDDPYTFFYIDPPYPKGRDKSLYKHYDFSMDDLDRMMTLLKGVKGKFIVSLNYKSLPKPMPAGMKVKRILFPYPPIKNSATDGGSTRNEWRNHMEVFIHNYDLKTGKRFPVRGES